MLVHPLVGSRTAQEFVARHPEVRFVQRFETFAGRAELGLFAISRDVPQSAGNRPERGTIPLRTGVGEAAMKIVTVLGTVYELQEYALLAEVLGVRHELVVVLAGDPHEQVGALGTLPIVTPDYRLDPGRGSPSDRTARVLVEIERLFVREEPDLVIVPGETSAALAGALAAAKLVIPAAHIGAGVRSFDRAAHDEISRVLVDRMCTVLFSPTARAASNLGGEGILDHVHQVGDLTFDLFIRHRTTVLGGSCCGVPRVASRFDLVPGNFLLLSLRRMPEMGRTALKGIIDAVLSVDERIVLPVGREERQVLAEIDLLDRLESAAHVMLVDPLAYEDVVALQYGARMVLADSGRVQKESYFACTPCLTLSAASEWPETIEDGWNLIVGSDTGRIVDAIGRFRPGEERGSLFGDGRAIERIAEHLEEWGRSRRARGSSAKRS
ncbi:hypothetical protein AMJ82_01180 [candidate division TA06 bacterium SM23_40]|uniref:UDP-N-acetylglucosamine 2-epimerase domain-containing protein n=3 Tax=Bacteria division TA06 TaxID=1156500 RepID=A0A0S8GED3_UNCT6|nr:MAG: hypothetical protein AMJ82_01180 [candidate division TA06 bacterium SM23_40]